jgi:hypothetical protein
LRVSVVINAFGSAKFLGDALASLGASLPFAGEVEVIVVGKDTMDVVGEAFAGVVLVPSPETALGPRLAAGIHRASGEVIAFLDDDDVFLPQKLGVLCEVFADPDVAMFRHPVLPVNESLFPLSGMPPSGNPDLSKPNSSRTVTIHLPLSRTMLGQLRRNRRIYNLSSMAVRRTAAIETLDTLRDIDVGVDFAMPALLTGPGKLVISSGPPLSLYRVHSSLSRTGFAGPAVPDSHLRYLQRSVHSAADLACRCPTDAGRAFFDCRARTWNIFYWALTGQRLLPDQTGSLKVFAAIRSNVAEGNLSTSAFLLTAAILGGTSRRLARRMYIWHRRGEYR